MESFAVKNNQKKVWLLALASVVMSTFFSFLGAPFLRALSVAANSKIFWLVGLLLTCFLMIAGLTLTSVYIGAIWMTLGAYGELEKRGISWKIAGAASLAMGLLFGLVSYGIVIKYFNGQNLLTELLQPLQDSMNIAFPNTTTEISVLVSYVPGIFTATLFTALAIGFMLEARVNRLFQIRHAKIASGLKWLEYRLPDLFIWASLFAGFFSLVNLGQEVLQKVSINIVIFSAVAFFFQGLVVLEFMTRAFRLGTISKTILYILVVLQLIPAVVLVGLVDYWVDFRKRLRTKIKANTI